MQKAMLIVHTPEDVRRALAAYPNQPLATPPDFCCYAGVAYGHAMQEAAAPFSIMIGCGSDAAAAHDAMRLGIDYVYTSVDAPLLEKLRSIASQVGATITEHYPVAHVDMRNHCA